MSQIDTQPLHDEAAGQEQPRKTKVNYGKEFLAGLTVSFAALSLGAAFGDSSGRGPLKGVLSAGFLALITSGVGGTLVQCSGPTAPMTAVTVKVTEYASTDFAGDFPNNNPELFVNMTMILCAILMAIMGACQVGKLIVFVPNVVVSGFMNGIAIMIWIPKVQELFGLGKPQMTGNMAINVTLALLTTFLIFNIPKLTGRFCPAAKSFLPGTLVAIVLVTVFVVSCGGLGIQTVRTGEPINSFGEVGDLFKDNFPTEWSGSLIIAALPFACQLAMLGYIDTLLTSRIVDAKVVDMYPPEDRWRPTYKNLELLGQALGNAFCALFGGIPGAQATIRSVLILNEGAMTRMAGIAAGLFTIIEMGLFQSLVGKIPQCVLTGVLFKVGYDCFDWGPFLMYINTKILGKQHPGATDPSKANEPVVTHGAFVFILATAILNSQFALHIVVGASVLVYYVVDRFITKIPDLEAYSASTKDSACINNFDGEASPDVEAAQADGATRKTSAVERELSAASVHGQQDVKVLS
jgi:SulP family sulfate permease